MDDNFDDEELDKEVSTEEPMVAEGIDIRRIDSAFFTSREALTKTSDVALVSSASIFHCLCVSFKKREKTVAQHDHTLFCDYICCTFLQVCKPFVR